MFSVSRPFTLRIKKHLQGYYLCGETKLSFITSLTDVGVENLTYIISADKVGF